MKSYFFGALAALFLAGCTYTGSEDIQCEDGQTRAGSTCVDGYWVRAETPECDGGDCCVPTTCEAEGAECGQLDDGCGAVLECGGCPDGESCGLEEANQCSEGACEPATCGDLECGEIEPGCGLVAISCGECTAPETCGAITANMCDCVPTTCAELGFNCGMVADGCGAMLTCGECTSPETCGGAGDANICGCTPTTTCRSEGVACGTFTDDCGNEVECSEGCFENIDAGDRHACAVTSDGIVKCWGDNQFGQLGTGTGDDSDRPVPIDAMNGMTFKVADTGFNHSCAIASDDTLWCWGSNSDAQLGIDPTSNMGPGMRSRSPIQVPGLSNVSAVSAGAKHTCAVENQDTLKCWGDNDFLQTGAGVANPILSPTVVTGLTAPITSVSASTVHTCAVGDGGAFCWGSDGAGQLGNGNGAGDSATPDGVSGNATYVSVTTGLLHSCGLTDDDRLLCWGAIQYDSSNNAVGTVQTPTEKTIATMTSVIDAAFTSTCGAHPAGVQCFGRNDLGQLGDGTRTDSTAAVDVVGFVDAVDATSGVGFSCGIKATKEAFCWGRNNDGQLGDGNSGNDSPTPVKVLP